MSKKQLDANQEPVKSKKELKAEAKQAAIDAKEAEKQAKIDAKNAEKQAKIDAKLAKKNKGKKIEEITDEINPIDEIEIELDEAQPEKKVEESKLEDSKEEVAVNEDSKEEMFNDIPKEAPEVEKVAPVKKVKKSGYFAQTFSNYGLIGILAVAAYLLACFTLVQAVNPVELAGGQLSDVFTYLIDINNLPVFLGTVGAALAALCVVVLLCTQLFSRKVKLVDLFVMGGFAVNIGLWIFFVIDNFEKASFQDALGNIIFSAVMVIFLVIRCICYKPVEKYVAKKQDGDKVAYGKYLGAVNKKFNFALIIVLSIAGIAVSYSALNSDLVTAAMTDALKQKLMIISIAILALYVIGCITRCVKKNINIIDFISQFLIISSLGTIAIGAMQALESGAFVLEDGQLALITGVVGFVLSAIFSLIFAANTITKKPAEVAVVEETPVEEPIEVAEEEPVEEAIEVAEEIAEDEPVEEAIPVAEEITEEEPVEEAIPVAEEITEEEEEPVEEALLIAEDVPDEEVVEEVAEEVAIAEDVAEEIPEEAPIEEVIAEDVIEESTEEVVPEVIPVPVVEDVKEEKEVEEINQRLNKIEDSVGLLELTQRVEKIENNTNTISDINARIDKIEQNVEKILNMLLAGAVVAGGAAVANAIDEDGDEIVAVDEPTVEETVEEVVTPAPVAKQNLDWQKEVTDESRVKPKMSFEMKLRKLDDDIKGFYSDIKNALMSYGIKNRISRFRENFNKGRNQIARFTVNGSTLCLFLAIDPDSIDASYYHHKSYVDKKGAVDVPTMIKIRSKVAARKAIELIDIICESLVIKKKKNFEPVNYVEEFTLDGFTTVECKGLDFLVVGEMDLAQATALPDGLANQLIELVEGDEPVFNPQIGVVTIDQLQEKFEDGDIVDLQACRDKKLVAKDCNYLSILEGKYINKKLRVFANEYNADAVKMVCLAGGEAFMIVDPV